MNNNDKTNNEEHEESEIEDESFALEDEGETGHDEELSEEDMSELLTEESVAFLTKPPETPGKASPAPAKPATAKAEPAAAAAPTKPSEQATIAVETAAHITPNEIPVNLVVEIGRIQMNVQKLLQLEPGNLLELNVHPEQGVDLVINSKKVGKGELVRVGENLGIRILEIGS